ncbi:MAG: glucose-1-phosphate adenylyltransferase [Verrucomicrobiae bacterium]|nr:glucose-1-phosphate adenylyltransferase [Verrucomicrobiae bacterium]
MSSPHSSPLSTANVLAVIMGGGQGARLYPLTKLRSKPAVPLGAKYRLVDIPISNCINSDIRRIYVLTQFNSASLHRHILETYRFDHFSRGFVEICAAQLTPEEHSGWYQGTADAVRQNLRYFFDHRPDYVLILSGDQLYRMDFRRLIRQHVGTFADITVATVPVPRSKASSLGILQTDDEKRIFRFCEKPKDPLILDKLKIADPLLSNLHLDPREDHYLASMGIYVFSRNALVDALNNDKVDFGKDIIPSAIQTQRVNAYVHQGYWEDIGTIGSFFEANLDITSTKPKFNFFDRSAPIYTRPRFLPPSHVAGGEYSMSVISEGCTIGENTRLDRTVVGVRGIVQAGCHLQECVVMGNDFYEDPFMMAENESRNLPHLGIGKGCKIRRAIIDKNAQIGANCVISPDGKPSEADHPLYCIRDGIVVIPKNTVIPDGTII